MAGRRGGSYAPSYNQVAVGRSKGARSHRFKKPMEVATEAINIEKSENITLHG